MNFSQDQVPLWYDSFYVRGIPFRRTFLAGKFYEQSRIADLLSMQVQADDVFFASFVRSGNHWTKFILGCIYAGGDYTGVCESSLTNQVKEFEISPMENVEYFTDAAEQTTGPRLFHTHMHSSLVPPGVRNGQCKVILLIRNPKDTLTSWYHFMKGSTKYFSFEGSFDEAFSGWLNGTLNASGSKDWFSFVKSWLELRSKVPMLIVHYEDMKRDLYREIQRLSEFLGVPLSEDDIRKISEIAEFSAMKWHKCVEFLEEFQDIKDAKFLRKGVVGDWKTLLTVAQSEEIDKRLETLKQETGYEIKME